MTQAEILLVLLSWASHLSGYPMQPVPELHFRPHSFFVEHACNGKECTVVGWYTDDEIVYIDDIYRGNLEDAYPSSLVVHEFVHYLQHKSGYWRNMTCEKRLSREREAYYVQGEYTAKVTGHILRSNPYPVSC